MVVPVVGLTGGIASGKSTVARAFAKLGVPVVDADQLAREVVAPGSQGLAELVRAFGDSILRADGSLDRSGLGARVFRDPDERRKLNQIVHPRIALLSAERLRALDPERHRYALYEAALIVENGLHQTMRALVVVALPPALQLARIMQRDRLDRAAAEARLAAQAPLEAKLACADFVIDNSGDLSALEGAVLLTHEALLARLEEGAHA